jgi:hypothetical protein
MEMLDIANLHSYSPATKDVNAQFFNVLAETDDFSIFDRKVVRKIIEFKWPLTREFIVKMLFIPFVIFMAFYISYMNFVYYLRWEHPRLNYTFQSILAAFSVSHSQ